MDDAHQIVLVGLEHAGVTLPTNSAGAHDVGQAELVAICSQAVSLIQGGSGAAGQKTLPTVLPVAMAEKFRVCTDLSGAIKQLGYPADLSFHQFLYPSEADTHRLLRFLLDKLSKSSSRRTRGSRKGRGSRGRSRHGEDDIGGSAITATVRQRLSQWQDEWRQSASIDKETVKEKACRLRHEWEGRSLETAEPVSSEELSAKFAELLTAQWKSRAVLVPRVLELNARSALKAAWFNDIQFAHASNDIEAGKNVQDLGIGGQALVNGAQAVSTKQASFESSFLRAVKFAGGRDWNSPTRSHVVESMAAIADETGGSQRVHGAAVSATVAHEDGEVDTISLEQEASSLSVQAEKLEENIRNMERQIRKVKGDFEAATNSANLQAEESQLLERAVQLSLHTYDSPEASVEAIESQIRETKQQMAALQDEWELVQRGLEEEKANLEKSVDSSKDQVQVQLRNLKEVRQQIKQISLKIQAREQEEAALSAEVKSLKGGARSTYVRRITELIRNSKKQDADIMRIINETRTLQRDSNAAQDRLRRSHALVDETVFRDARTDPVCRQAYMLLTSVHQNFADIVDKIYEMDKTGREVTELEAMLEDLEKRSLDMTSVQADLDAVVAENISLEKMLG